MPDRSAQPYVGPRPFETADRELFFGRMREADDLISLIMFHRTILLYAQSGAGKSSLINTSIVPELQQSEFIALPPVRLRGAPTTALPPEANAYIYNVQFAMAPETLEESGRPLRLARLLARFAPADGGHAPVLIFDQFEELFTTHQDRWQDREDFFQQIAETLDAIPTLRILFSMREEYIAYLDPYVPRIPHGIDARYRLELLRHQAAIDAVTEPARRYGVEYDSNAAQKLVHDLEQVNVEAPDGSRLTVAGEFVEPVQLQIVCRRLWDRLPLQVTLITEQHLQQFGDVSSALREFYETAVHDTAERCQYPEKLIHLGCTQFVTSSGTRSLVYRARNFVGSLPGPVADALVNHHFLRAETRAGALWYEIAHDRLIEPVLERKNDEEIKNLIQNRELLKAAVEQWRGRTPRAFDKDRKIVGALSAVEGELPLSEEELEYLCMNSIGAGFEIPGWVNRLQAQVPQVLERVLQRAATATDVGIRQNATDALALVDTQTSRQLLLQLTFDDENADVRRRAAVAIARAEHETPIAETIARLHGRYRVRALYALARMRDDVVTSGRDENLWRQWRTIGRVDRLALLISLAVVRLGVGWPKILYIGMIGGILSGIFCTAGRIPAATFGKTITDVGSTWAKGAGTGLFQGMTGGITWGGMTAACIALGWVLFRRPGLHWWNGRLICNVVFGIIGGIIGGIIVGDVEIFLVFNSLSLEQLHWILSKDKDTLAACIDTGYCLFHPGLGFAFGGGAGVTLATLHASQAWRRFLAPHIAAGTIVNFCATCMRAVVLATTFSIGTGILLYLSALMFYWVKHFPLPQTVGETATIFTGNVGTVAGIMMAQLMMRFGFEIPRIADSDMY